jgi:STE24 endopeptidase
MSEMTATRMQALKVGTYLVATAAWLGAAAFLWRTQVPDDLVLPRVDAAEFFSAEELRRAARHDAFLRVDVVLSLLAGVAALGAVAWQAARIDRLLPGPTLVRGLLLGLIAFGAAWLARLPFGAAAHWWERRYGLATRGWPSWLWHRLPGPGELAVLLAGIGLAMLLGRALGRRWWLAAAPLAVGLAAVLVLVGPLLSTLRPLPDREVAAEVRRIAAEEGLDDVRIGVERASKRTRRANAEAIGLGPTRRIVLWDTLLDGRFTTPEIVVIAAHEVAHLKRRHALRGLGWFALFALPCAFVVAAAAARRGGPGSPPAIPVVLLAVACLQVASLPVVGAITRRYEAEADWLALETTRDPVAAVALFQRLGTVNIDEPRPPGWAFLLLSDHPTLLQRIAMAQAWREDRGASASRAGAPPAGS